MSRPQPAPLVTQGRRRRQARRSVRPSVLAAAVVVAIAVLVGACTVRVASPAPSASAGGPSPAASPAATGPDPSRSAGVGGATSPAGGPTAGSNVDILCDGQVFDGFRRSPFILDSARHRDPAVLKVIRNCTFRNGNQPAIVVRGAANVLIEGNTFEAIRTRIPGDGVHAIAIRGRDRADGIVIRDNDFRFIGADGVQLGDSGREVRDVTIADNRFEGSEGVGENAVDVKGVEGPILIRGNVVHGFRPCLSPKKGGTQDCSGSEGAGIVVHDGEASGPAARVTLEANDVYDNVYGITVSNGARSIVVNHNRLHDNTGVGLLVDEVTGISIAGNEFRANPVHVRIQDVTSGCVLGQNDFLDVETVELVRASCAAS